MPVKQPPTPPAETAGHADLITANGGPKAFAEALYPKLPGTMGYPDVGELVVNVKAWKRTDSIPGPYWAAIQRAGLCTLVELAEAAEAKFRRKGG